MFRTLRAKFTLVYLGLTLLAALAGVAGAWNLSRLERSVDALMTENYKSIDAIYRMMEAIERQDSAVLLYIGVDRQQGIQQFAQNQNDFERWLNIETDNVTEDGEREVLDGLRADYNVYSRTLYDLQARGLQDPAARDFYLNTTQPIFERIKERCRQLVQINERAMFAARDRTTGEARRSMQALLGVALLVLAAGLIVSQFFIRRFLRPIQTLTGHIRQVREGNLGQSMDVGARDEAGQLAMEFNDMTRRLQDYERSNLGTLLSERNRSVAIVQSISDPLMVLDAHWRIQLINEACAGYFHIDARDAAGRHFLEVIHDGALFRCVEALVAGADAGGRQMTLYQDGQRYFNLAATRLHSPEHAGSGVILALHDITDIKELEKVRTDFLASISHEFKTPLTSILMASSMLGEGGLGALSADQVQAVQTIAEDGERLLALVNELLELMRIESGRQVYHMEPCRMADIAAACVEGFRDAAQRRGITLRCAMGEDLPPVTADFEKIRWVLNNLISNAINYSDAGDAIDVTARAEGGFIEVSVRDTGIGIAPQYLDRIFDKFVSVEGDDIEVRGTGLGLSVAKEIVRGHGGDIQVRSEAGEGSTFTFTLRIAGEEA